MPLTAYAVKNAAIHSKAYKLSDGKGLYLLVKPNGGKYWRLAYRYQGKQKTLAIGTTAAVTLSEARKVALAAKEQLHLGNDPAQVKRTEKASKSIEQATTFESVAREFHSVKVTVWSEDHGKRWLRSMEANVFPDIGRRPIAEIMPTEIISIIRKIEKRGALSFTGDVLQRVGSVFKYAKITSRCATNPAEGLSATRKKRDVRHQPALPKELLPEFFSRLDAYNGNAVTTLALRLLVLTLLRPGEVRKARWEEIDLGRELWEIPAERMKMRRPHVVPLSKQAVEMLTQARQYSANLEHVFPGRQNPRRPMCENTLNQVMHRLGYKGVGTSHGFRSTGSSVLNEQGFNPDAIERQLAHEDGDKVRAAYNRAEYLAERTSMMQWWADYLDGKAERPDNVVPITRKSA